MPVAVEKPPRVIGRNTVHAMQSGLFLGYVALVEGLIDRIAAEMEGAADGGRDRRPRRDHRPRDRPHPPGRAGAHPHRAPDPPPAATWVERRGPRRRARPGDRPPRSRRADPARRGGSGRRRAPAGPRPGSTRPPSATAARARRRRSRPRARSAGSRGGPATKRVCTPSVERSTDPRGRRAMARLVRP